MPNLPQFQTDDTNIGLLQNRWAAILNPVIANPLNGITVLKNVKLAIGINSIPHLLQKNLQGWFIVRQRAAASIYDQQDDNQSPQLTLKLISDAIVSVDVAVY